MIELLVGLILIHTQTNGVFVYNLSTRATESVSATSTPLTIQDKVVKELGADFLPIIKCESNFQQFRNGKPLVSNTSDVGVTQINHVHWQRAKDLGLDIFHSEDDNIAMAKIILKEQGRSAWVCAHLVMK